MKEARIEIEERVRRVGEERAEGAVIINRRLPALRAVRAGQRCAAILAMGQRADVISAFDRTIFVPDDGRAQQTAASPKISGVVSSDIRPQNIQPVWAKSNPEAARIRLWRNQ